MGLIPETIIDEIRDRADIVDVISGYIPLKRAGRNFKTLCPFHHEKTPSFIVNSDKQIYHCFGCGEGGNVFSFIMKQERLEFYEAVRLLASRTNIKLPERTKDNTQNINIADEIRGINEAAADYYSKCLFSEQQGAGARKYLAKRDVNGAGIKTFRLGYAPAIQGGLKGELLAKRFGSNAIEESRLSAFAGRLMFPIMDARGRIVGFGGRIIDDSDKKAPKYLNSPETAAYIKGRHLYGLNIARDIIIERDRCVIVEGYFDCITLHQHGVTNAVASLGTALTPEQIRLIKRYTKNVFLVYDADAAGESATLRGIELFLEEDISVRVVILEEGADPDTFIRKEGRLSFEQRLNNASEFIDYSINKMFLKYNPATVEGRVAISNQILPLLAKVNNSILRAEYIKKFAETLKVGEDVLIAELRRIMQDARRKDRQGARLNMRSSALNIEHKDARILSERILAGIMLEDTDTITGIKARLSADEFKDADMRRIVSAIYEIYSCHSGKITPNGVINFLHNDGRMAGLIAEILLETEHIKDKNANIEDCIERINSDKLQDSRQEIQRMLEVAWGAGNEQEAMSLLRRYNKLIKRKQERADI